MMKMRLGIADVEKGQETTYGTQLELPNFGLQLKKTTSKDMVASDVAKTRADKKFPKFSRISARNLLSENQKPDGLHKMNALKRSSSKGIIRKGSDLTLE